MSMPSPVVISAASEPVHGKRVKIAKRDRTLDPLAIVLYITTPGQYGRC
jgi:hypothetical protein